MTIRIRSGTERLITGVRSYFLANQITAVVDVGDRSFGKHLNQGIGSANRVVFCAFDPKSGDAGTLLEPMLLGEIPIASETDPTVQVGATRALWDWKRNFVVSMWAFDSAAPEDDLAQDCAAERLLEDVINAVHATSFADVAWSQIGVVTQGERRLGRELRARLAFTHPLYERPSEVARPDFEITKSQADEPSDEPPEEEDE